jgi:hypothetical protein
MLISESAATRQRFAFPLDESRRVPNRVDLYSRAEPGVVTGERQEPKPGGQSQLLQVVGDRLHAVRVGAIRFGSQKATGRTISFRAILPFVIDLYNRQTEGL